MRITRSLADQFRATLAQINALQKQYDEEGTVNSRNEYTYYQLLHIKTLMEESLWFEEIGEEDA